MIRTPDWKLVKHLETGGQDELYHLAEDPGETRDLGISALQAHRTVREFMTDRLKTWMLRIGDRPSSGSDQSSSVR
jgi:hypothetical protein